MEFWRIYRLIYAKRFLILATMIFAAVVIYLGTSIQTQKRTYEAEATLQPQEAPKLSTEVATVSGGTATVTESQNALDSQMRISNLIMVLRSSNDLYVKTADLLREDEAMRVLDVERILDRNAYFTSLDQEIKNQASALVSSGSLTEATRDKWILDNTQSQRKKAAEALAKGEDGSGPFAEAGLKDSEAVIADRIRQNMSFDTVVGPLSTDNAPQIADQIKVTGRFEREAEAQLYVNLICVEFLDYYTNQQSSAMNARIALLNEKSDEVNRRLQQARKDKVAFLRASATNLTASSDAAFTKAAQTEAQRDAALAELSSEDAAVSTLEAALKGAQSTRTNVLPAEENPQVKALQAQLDTANIAFAAVKASNAGENSDRYLSAKAQVDTAQSELNRAKSQSYTLTTVDSGLSDLQSRLTQAMTLRNGTQQRLAVLNQQLTTQQAAEATLPAAQARLKDLDSEIAISEQTLNGLKTTISKVQIDDINNGKAGTISIVSEAHVTPLVSGIASQRPKLMAYGMALALLFGVALVIGLDALDNSVRTGEDLEKLTGLPVAGIIPEHLPDPVRSPRVALLEPLSPAAEAYRLLRTDLLFTAAERPFQSLLTATAKPAQGATTTLCNLAIVLAQSGRSVVLVDADLRQAKLHRIFNTANDVGLTSVLGDRSSLDEALAPTEVENLTLLPAGPFVNNPTDILDSPRMHALHENLKQRFDYVLFDTPAAIAYSDTAILSSFVDATMVVIRANSVPRGAEDQVRVLLNKARANIIGAILNGVAPEQVDSVHFHAGGGFAALPPPPSSNGTGGSGAAALGGGPATTPYQNTSVGGRVPGSIARGGAVTPDDEDTAIALPGNVGESDHSSNGATATPDAVYDMDAVTAPGDAPAALPQPLAAVPARTNPTVATPSYQGPFDNVRSKGGNSATAKRSVVPLKTLGLIAVAGTVVGLLVLLLGSGVGVK